jgi:hypothetical protein
MGEYRAFILGEDGHVCEGYGFEGASDEAAVRSRGNCLIATA